MKNELDLEIRRRALEWWKNMPIEEKRMRIFNSDKPHWTVDMVDKSTSTIEAIFRGVLQRIHDEIG